MSSVRDLNCLSSVSANASALSFESYTSPFLPCRGWFIDCLDLVHFKKFPNAIRDTERSAVAQHIVMNPEHKIGFDDTQFLCNMQHYYPRLHHEAIEIYKHKNNFNNKDEGLKIHKSWYPALKMCKVKPLITKNNNIETDQSGFSGPSAGQSRSSSTHAPSI